MHSSNVVILPYKMGSRSASALARELTQSFQSRVRQLFNDNRGKFVPRQRHTLLNWGCSTDTRGITGVVGRVVNPCERVGVAGNKLATFRALSNAAGVRIPAFTEDRAVATDWITNDRGIVVCRTKLTGHSGDGIVVAHSVEQLVNAPLYTRYVKKRKEFRVHVAFNEVIDVQEKRRRSDYDGELDQYVRSFHRGWVFCRENIEEPTELRPMAVGTINSLGLDFGAVDIIWNERANECYVLEVNTAPGLEGTTVQNYVNAFTEYFQRNNHA